MTPLLEVLPALRYSVLVWPGSIGLPVEDIIRSHVMSGHVAWKAGHVLSAGPVVM